MDVDVEFDMAELQRELEKLGIHARNQRDVNQQAAEIMFAMVEEKLDAQGPGWKPHAPATIKRRGRGRLLQDTGLLANSLTPVSGDDFAMVFTNVEYAQFHISGTRDMPARDFFDIDFDDMLDQISELILESIGEGR